MYDDKYTSIQRFLLRYIRHFKSDLNSNMDHMRNSGNELSSLILSKTKLSKKMKSDAEKLPKQARAKRNGEINPKNYNFDQI